MSFETKYDEWIQSNILSEKNPRRREQLLKGLRYSTIQFLKLIWYPAVGNFDHLYPEWEVRDSHNRYRYIDLAYMPGGAKGAIEIQDYGSHARDLDIGRFKDLCRRHSLLSLDDWTFLFVAFPSVSDEPKLCQQLVLSFVGKMITYHVEHKLNWLEAETIRFARRHFRSFTPHDLAEHLKVSGRYARHILRNLVDLKLLKIAGGTVRKRSYTFSESVDEIANSLV